MAAGRFENVAVFGREFLDPGPELPDDVIDERAGGAVGAVGFADFGGDHGVFVDVGECVRGCMGQRWEGIDGRNGLFDGGAPGAATGWQAVGVSIVAANAANNLVDIVKPEIDEIGYGFVVEEFCGEEPERGFECGIYIGGFPDGAAKGPFHVPNNAHH